MPCSPHVVADDPAVIPVQSTISLLENTSLHLAVYSSGDDLSPEDHTWIVNGVVIRNNTVSPSGKEITIPSVQFQNDSQYSCRVVKSVGLHLIIKTAVFTVTVYGKWQPSL